VKNDLKDQHDGSDWHDQWRNKAYPQHSSQISAFVKKHRKTKRQQHI
jgi:hypothetical protein